jgi:phenylpropionate dioxygenase-like ring-hydroxylating dioxygenase large terminal subunit
LSLGWLNATERKKVMTIQTGTGEYSTRNPGPFGGPIQVNYPRNCWWAAARSADIGDKPFGCQMLDTPVVLFRRGSDQHLVAMHDRCAHRWAPLSAGWVEGDRIVCGYHGMEYESSGKCVRIPSQDRVPPKACVKAYPVLERHGMVWVWLGDPQLASQTEPGPELSFITDPAWTVVTGETPLEANYMMLKENVLDLTHFGFVHRNSIQVTDWTRAPKVEVGDTTVTYIQEFPSAPLAFVYGMPTGIGSQRPVYRKNWGSFLTPAVNIGAVEVRDPEPAPGARSLFSFRVAHLTTPISATRTRYWWFQGWDIQLPAEFVAKWQQGVEVGYAEDKVVLNALQHIVSTDAAGCDYPEILAQADLAAIQARRKLQALLDAERDMVGA